MGNSFRTLGFTSYEDYLRSPHWKEFKERYRKSSRPCRCEVCGCGRVQLHHNTYARIGKEELADVTPLCQDHHKEVHAFLRAKGKTVECTAEAVRRIREGCPVVAPEQARKANRRSAGKRRRKQARKARRGQRTATGPTPSKKDRAAALASKAKYRAEMIIRENKAKADLAAFRAKQRADPLASFVAGISSGCSRVR